jgi:hypothetical protein
MYQYNDRVTQLFTKYKLLLLLPPLQAMYGTVNHTGFRLERKTCTALTKLLYRPDDDPDKGRNIAAKAKYMYTC